MATNKLVDLADIASLIEAKLNELSQYLFTETDNTTEIVFNITDNMDDYDRMTYVQTTEDIWAGRIIKDRTYKITVLGTTDFTLIGATNNEVDEVFVATGPGTGSGVVVENSLFTPGIITKLSSSITPDANLGMYSETYSIEFYGYQEEYDDLKRILDTYVIQQKGAYSSYSGWLIQELTEAFDFVGNISPQDGSGKDRLLTMSTMAWGFLDGGVHSSQISIKIDEPTPIAVTDIAVGVEYRILDAGTTDWTLVGAASSTNDLRFISTSTGSGDGTAQRVYEVPVENYSFDSNKLPLSGVFDGEELTESVMESAAYSISIDIPYLTSNPVILTLVKDILQSPSIDLNTYYNIEYNDGTIELLYKMIRAKGTLSYGVGGIASMSLVFIPFKIGVL